VVVIALKMNIFKILILFALLSGDLNGVNK